MNFITKLVRPALITRLRAGFAGDVWKERDQSAEKVYISAEEKRSLDKLLQKLEESEHNPGAKDAKFQQCLKELLKKHDVTNQAFEAEVINLHRQV